MPELVLFSAWEQRHSAVSLMEMYPDAVEEGMAKIAKDKSGDGETKDREVGNKEVQKRVSVSRDEEIAEVGNESPTPVGAEEEVTEVTLGSENGTRVSALEISES